MRDSLLLLLSTFTCSNAFAAFTSPDTRQLHPFAIPQPSATRLPMTTRLSSCPDDWGHDDVGSSPPPNKCHRTRKQHVPLLGPFPGAPPLMLGGEMFLDPPTPLQWQALEESVMLHQKYLKEQQSQTETEAELEHTASENVDGNVPKTTGVDAAPLVAVIDNVTGKGKRGRYATLAALVGASSSTTMPEGIDTSDETSFMESLSIIGTTQSRVRLVGIGRAILTDFFYKMPTRTEKDDGEDDDDDECDDLDEGIVARIDVEDNGDLGMDSVARDGAEECQDYDTLVEDEHRDEDEAEEEEEREFPIIMAEFAILTDSPMSSTADATQLGNKGAPSVHRSPVHALAEMSRIMNRVVYLHDDRRRLVEGLKAARIRLERSNVFEDHDGIGGVTSKVNDDANQESIGSLHTGLYVPGVELSDDETCEDIAAMENYGLNYYSSFSAISQLTDVALQSFQSYYSPEVRQSEEHEMEVASFVAFRALDGFCSPQDFAFALQCTNTIERLDAAYNLMRRHKDLLEKIADYTSQDLRDCGEECTDLW